MIKFDDVTKESIKKRNLIWAPIPDHPHGILKIGSSGSGKTNSLFKQTVTNQILINLFTC